MTLKIKNIERNTFQSVDTSQIVLYESTNQEAPPLHPFYVTWNPIVTWGSVDNPLIVKVIPVSISAPNNNGKHINC